MPGVKGENSRSIETGEIHAAINPVHPLRHIDPIVGFQRIEKRGRDIPGTIGGGNINRVFFTSGRCFSAGVGTRQ